MHLSKKQKRKRKEVTRDYREEGRRQVKMYSREEGGVIFEFRLLKSKGQKGRQQNERDLKIIKGRITRAKILRVEEKKPGEGTGPPGRNGGV